MELKGFEKMSTHQQEQSYGGWAWLVALVPIMIQSIMTAVTAYKLLTSDNGSAKYNGADVKWSDNKESTGKSSTKTNHVIYAF